MEWFTVHYPFDALKAEEKTQVCRILEQFGVQIWMSGHLHDVLVQQHRKAFYEFQCGNLLTDGGIPNILIGQLDIESGEGEVRAYMWQQNGGWTLNRFLDRMSKVDKSLYCFELSPTEFMKRSGKVSVKETDRPEISELRSLAVEKIEKMYEDRHTILKDCIYGDLKYPVVVKAWTPAEADTIYVIDKLERNSYCLEKMEKWIQILDEYEENYRRIVQRSSIGILQLVVEEACSDEQKEYYEKDFRDICEKFYRNRELEIDIIERDTEVLEVCYKNIVDLYHEVDEFKFYIRYSALYIYFDVYEISSYSMGYVDLYIMDLQEFLSERCDISECDIVRKQAIFEKIFKPNIR